MLKNKENLKRIIESIIGSNSPKNRQRRESETDWFAAKVKSLLELIGVSKTI